MGEGTAMTKLTKIQMVQVDFRHWKRSWFVVQEEAEIKELGRVQEAIQLGWPLFVLDRVGHRLARQAIEAVDVQPLGAEVGARCKDVF